MALILDTDLLCIERGGLSYKWTGIELKTQMTNLAPVQSVVGIDPIVVEIVDSSYRVSIKNATTAQRGATVLTNIVDTTDDKALTPLGAKTALDLKANLDGSNATGTWNINITGTSPGSELSQNSINAENVHVERDDGTNANRYLTFVDSLTEGNQKLNMDSGLSYNPSTNTLTATVFKGDLTGSASNAVSSENATNAVNSDNATNVNVLSDPNTGNVRYLNFSASPSGNTRIRSDDGLKYYPSSNTIQTGNLELTGTLSAGNISASSSLSVTNLVASGNVRAGTLTVSGGAAATSLSLSADLTCRNISATNDLTVREIRASGNVNSSGTVSCRDLSVSNTISASSFNVTNLTVSNTLSARWITTTSGQTTSTIARVYASQDSYIRWCSPNHLANSMSNVVKTPNNSSLNSDNRNTRGVTRLYRRDNNSDFSVQTYWTGSHWMLYGYQGDGGHAGCRVAYSDSSGSASTANRATSAANADRAAVATRAETVNINYNNNSNSTYQMLWGSGNSVYGTGGITCNPSSNKIYTNNQELATTNYVNTQVANNKPAPKTLTASRQWIVSGSNWPYGYGIPSLYEVQATTSLYNQGGGRVRVGANQFFVDCSDGIFGTGWLRWNVSGSLLASDGNFLGARVSSRATKKSITYVSEAKMRHRNDEIVNKFMSLRFAAFQYDLTHYLNKSGSKSIQGNKFGLIAEDVMNVDSSWVTKLPTHRYDGDLDKEVPIDENNTDQHYALNEYDIQMSSMYVTRLNRLATLKLEKQVEELTEQVAQLKYIIDNTK